MSEQKICEQCKNKRAMLKNRTRCAGCRRFNSQVKQGVYRAPDYPEVNTANYKDPMEKVEDGFGYVGAVTTTNDGKLIQCHICGYYYKSLGSHVRNGHKITPRDYKLKFGLRIKDGLLSPVARVEAQLKYNKYTRKTTEEYKEMSRKGQEAIKAKGYKPGGDTWSAQTRNERGMCREQTLAKIRHIAEQNNGIPSYKLTMLEYGEGQKDVVRRWFGSWDNAVKEAGLQTHSERLVEQRYRFMRDTLNNIYRFWKKTGRTPQSSDFNSIDWLPSQRTITKRFGSLNKARVAAGVPELLYLNGQWVEVLADKYQLVRSSYLDAREAREVDEYQQEYLHD